MNSERDHSPEEPEDRSESEGEIRRIPVELDEAGRRFLETIRHGPGALEDEERVDLEIRRTEAKDQTAVCHAGDVIGQVAGDVGHELSRLFDECDRRRIEARCDELSVRGLVEEPPGDQPAGGRRLVLLLPPPPRMLQELVLGQDE